MIKKKVTRKVISKPATGLETVSEKPNQEISQTKKRCIFCQSKGSPRYTDIATLKRFLTERGRIIPKLRNGLCSKHQRRVTKHIKYARHLALLPFTPKV